MLKALIGDEETNIPSADHEVIQVTNVGLKKKKWRDVTAYQKSYCNMAANNLQSAFIMFITK